MLLALSLGPKAILQDYGPYIVFLIVFLETGILLGFFLPGDSLLFTAGILASQGELDINIGVLLVGCFVAAVAGDQVGYQIGRRLGPSLFRRPDSRLFRQEFVERTRAFFERHGPKTIVIARFVPIVRTFAPVVAGVGEMRLRTFTTYNMVGAFLWAVGVTGAGYLLGDALGDSIDQYLYPMIALIIIASFIPPLLEWRKHRKARQLSSAEAQEAAVELHEILDED